MKKKVMDLKLISRLGLEVAVSELFIALLFPKIFGDHRRLAQIKIAINEACINAIEHGNKLDESKSVYCEIFEGPNFFEISIADEGETSFHIDPGKIPTREEMEKKIETAGRRNKNRGMGTYFIHYFSDEVMYSDNASKGTKVNLKFYID